MSDDLVKRLRDMCGKDGILAIRDIYDHDVAEAADRIEKLEAELVRTFDNMMADAKRVEKLEAALRELSTDWDCCVVSKNMKLIARKALEGKDD